MIECNVAGACNSAKDRHRMAETAIEAGSVSAANRAWPGGCARDFTSGVNS
jgi:hypothetical protein